MDEDRQLAVRSPAEPRLLRVNALHALTYCKRLFYLEEVEELYTQDAAVYAGRTLHLDIEKAQGDELVQLVLESEELGLRGKVDALKTANGKIIPYEHKRGRCYRNDDDSPGAWESDRIQLLAYCMLIESAISRDVSEGRIRYHGSNVTVTVPLDDTGRRQVREAIAEARRLQSTVERPPIAENERLCKNCSLAPVCLPEEARIAWRDDADALPLVKEPLRLFPPHDERKVLHIIDSTAKVGRSGGLLKVTIPDEPDESLPINQVGEIVIHGFGQITTQCLRACADLDVQVHYISSGGRYVGSFFGAKSFRVQRKIRQFKALVDQEFCVSLARNLVICRGDMQRQILMRLKRKDSEKDPILQRITDRIQAILKLVPQCTSLDKLRGLEGAVAALYFKSFPNLISEELGPAFLFNNRNRRPPKDRVNALLSYGYALLIKDVINAINVVGLEPAFGFYHQPRTAAPPLALDLMEIFRVLLVDIPVLNSLNRNQWEADNDFVISKDHVWLSDEGKKKLVSVYERRKDDTWKHPVIGYSISYGRMLELEVRLLEKEWMNEGGLFAKVRLR
jgi:CRISP-associated protein Cas1